MFSATLIYYPVLNLCLPHVICYNLTSGPRIPHLQSQGSNCPRVVPRNQWQKWIENTWSMIRAEWYCWWCRCWCIGLFLSLETDCSVSCVWWEKPHGHWKMTDFIWQLKTVIPKQWVEIRDSYGTLRFMYLVNYMYTFGLSLVPPPFFFFAILSSS